MQEQIYHVLDSEGLMELDRELYVVRRHDVIHIPAGSGARDLQFGPAGPGFLVASTPPSDAGGRSLRPAGDRDVAALLTRNHPVSSRVGRPPAGAVFAMQMTAGDSS